LLASAEKKEKHMKRQILVPLDGSALSETILPHVVTLSRLTSCELVLLRCMASPHLIEPISGAAVPVTASYEAWQAEIIEGRDYLNDVAGHLRSKGIIAQVALSEEEPATAIVACAKDPGIALIAMATHGRSGLRRWVFGSVAERVLHAAPKPLFLVRPTDSEHIKQAPPIPEHHAVYHKIVLPLDGSMFAEQALGWAQALASASGATLCLTTVVPGNHNYRTAAEKEGGLPVAAAVERAEVDHLSSYLKETSNRLRTAGLSVEGSLTEGRPAEVILHTAEETQADLIIMATHGRSGLELMWLGSVAQKVVQGATTPVLLVRAKEQ